MQNNHIKRIVILGGGTAGWMTAAAIAKIIKTDFCETILVESEEIGTVGVGEATIPQIQHFNRLLEINEDDFVRQTQATFKLGIQFVNWKSIGSQYIHTFGDVGRDVDSIQFYHYWYKMFKAGKARTIEDYSISGQACARGKFMRPIDAGNSPLSNIAYAFHFDAVLYARYLREYSEARGIKRIEAKVESVRLEPSTGHISSLVLNNGQEIAGDFFIDCSGFKGILIEGALKTGYDDWSHWLPCDRAWAVPCQSASEPTPFTRSTAHVAGWQWRIPLQHRVGNGHVFSSRFMSEDQARDVLMANLDGAPLADPKLLKFVTGKRKKFWNKNCLAIGLASGFMEPLESTSIHLVQSAIARLFTFFPNKQFAQEDIDEFNRQADFEFERIRDFLILHYCVTERDDSEFWRYCRNMPIPAELEQKIAQFKRNGRIFRTNNEMFNDLSWLEVMVGQGLMPESFHPLVDLLSETHIEEKLDSIHSVIQRSVDYMPSHQEFIDRHCKAIK